MTRLAAFVLMPLCAVGLFGQTGRTVSLAWNDAINPAGTQYNVYRADSACSGSPTFAKRNAAPVPTRSYDDTGVAPGTYCYRVTAVLAGFAESAPSTPVDASVGLAAPTGLTITIQIALTLDQNGRLVVRSSTVDIDGQRRAGN